MTIPANTYLRATACAALLGTASIVPANAATLAAFDFEDAGGAFDLSAETQHQAVAATLFSVEHGTLTDFAGHPGRALGATQFDISNRVRLSVINRAGQWLDLNRVQFDIRISPSGPQHWRLDVNGLAIAEGSANSTFQTIDIDLVTEVAGPALLIDITGSGANSAQGTLRLDNLVVFGSSAAVPLPSGLLLFASPLLAGIVTRRRARRTSARPCLPETGHERT